MASRRCPSRGRPRGDSGAFHRNLRWQFGGAHIHAESRVPRRTHCRRHSLISAQVSTRAILRGLPAVSCLAASLALLTVLSGCAANNPKSGRTSTNPTSTIAAMTPPSTPTAAGVPPPTRIARTEKWIDLQVGDCLAQLPPTDPSEITVTVVDCAPAHAAEVYLRAPMAVDAAIADVADQQCAAGFAQYTGRSVGGSSLAVTYLIDSNQDRTSDNPAPSTVICLLHATDGQPLTGSVRR